MHKYNQTFDCEYVANGDAWAHQRDYPGTHFPGNRFLITGIIVFYYRYL